MVMRLRPPVRAGLVAGAALIAIVVVAIGYRPACGCFHEPKEDTQRALVKQLVFEGFPDWAARHPSERCPDSLAEVAAEIGRHDALDVWGHPMTMFCGAAVPRDAMPDGFAVLSPGPDGIPATSDDITSWECSSCIRR
jgi:hypothetical protein